MASQIERNALEVFIAKLVVIRAGRHVWNIDDRQVDIMLDRGLISCSQRICALWY